ncbi:MAG: hypothetical protein U9R19_18165 [Bacteroidota bacterium]|nr:hypothetical protein [Bacteroidota bacterium]
METNYLKFLPAPKKNFRIKGLLVIALFITFSACEKNENDDPVVEIDDKLDLLNDLSAVWNLESGYSEFFHSTVKEFRWLDNVCENAVDGNGNPLPQEFDDKTVFSKAYNYTNALSVYNQLLTTTMNDPFDTLVNFTIPKNEYEDAYTKSNITVNYSYDLTIKKNGEYKVSVIYNHFEPDYPLYYNDEIEMQYGQSFSGTSEYVGNWYLSDNDFGLNQGIRFEGFPLIVVHILPVYDLTDITDIRFEFNYVSGIDFTTEDMLFEIENLTDTAMTLSFSENKNSYSQIANQEFEAYFNNFQVDCQGVFTEVTVKNKNQYLSFKSDGIDAED